LGNSANIFFSQQFQFQLDLQFFHLLSSALRPTQGTHFPQQRRIAIYLRNFHIREIIYEIDQLPGANDQQKYFLPH
jgi:hypothetical protein